MPRIGSSRRLMAAAAGAAVLASLLSVVPADAHSIRGHRIHGRTRTHIHLGGRLGFHASYYYVPHYYGHSFYYAPYPIHYPYAPAYLSDVAYIDTDISPEEAEVHLDGEYVGIADDYDGFPTYLQLSPGRHTVTFKLNGYRTVTRRIRVPRGAALNLEFSLSKGSSLEGPQGGRDEEIAVPDYPKAEGAPAIADEERGPGEDGEKPSFVRLKVTPSDASVYIDGKFYGTASRLSSLHGDLRLESGRHTIEVVRPGYRGIEREVNLDPGQHVPIDLDLERNGPGRRPPR